MPGYPGKFLGSPGTGCNVGRAGACLVVKGLIRPNRDDTPFDQSEGMVTIRGTNGSEND